MRKLCIRVLLLTVFIPWLPAFVQRRHYDFKTRWQRAIYLQEDDDPFHANLQALLAKLQVDDRSWLKQTLGNSFDKLMQDLDPKSPTIVAEPKTPTKVSTSFDNLKSQSLGHEAPLEREEQSVSRRPAVVEVIDVKPPAVGASAAPADETATFVALRRLGYSLTDITSMKDTVAALVVDKQLRRPVKIPPAWLKKERGAATASSSGSGSGGRKSGRSAQEEPRNRQAPATASGRPQGVGEQAARDRAGRFVSDSAGNEVRWRGNEGLTERERSAAYSWSPGDSSRGVAGEEEAPEVSFWPSEAEFKEYLLQEARWRLDALG
eukprot:gene41067-50101_t